MVLNTALRRLGCGGRASMGNEFPVPAVRRKFYESYRIPQSRTAVGSAPTSPTTPNGPSSFGSPSQSQNNSVGRGHRRNQSNSGNTTLTTTATGGPLTSLGGSGHSRSLSRDAQTATQMQGDPTSPQAAAADPLMLNVVELVKLIQAALHLWGMYGAAPDEVEVDGLFCDDTKKAIFKWRRTMGMESEEALKLEVSWIGFWSRVQSGSGGTWVKFCETCDLRAVGECAHETGGVATRGTRVPNGVLQRSAPNELAVRESSERVSTA